MFLKSKNIIYVGRGKLTAVEVIDAVQKKFGRVQEAGWSYETFDIALAELVNKFKSKEYRLLLSDDLAYVLRVEVPGNVAKNSVREFVHTKIQEKIPENVDENEWDYKEIKGKPGELQVVIAFAMVKKFSDILNKALSATPLIIEAVEPETIAKTRDSNAYIGLALKDDITGRDEDVLNIQLNAEQHREEPKIEISTAEKPSEANAVPPPKAQVTKQLFSFKLLFLIIPVVLIGILAGGLLYIRNSKVATTENMSMPEPEVANEVTISPSPESTSYPEIDLTKIKIQILNGTGTAGEATNVSEILGFEGFENFTIGNAQAFNYENTEISLKLDYANLFDTFERALNSEYAVVRAESELSTDNNFDVVVIVGVRL
jgi:hypothetical protein